VGSTDTARVIGEDLRSHRGYGITDVPSAWRKPSDHGGQDVIAEGLAASGLECPFLVALDCGNARSRSDLARLGGHADVPLDVSG
jgi:hypothetical protein